ncbi:MAG: hypothetical protein MZV70_35955 [Desulfobacterales bacterium]|nr:hypothetical protein [Desulfobacterales bacterium]
MDGLNAIPGIRCLKPKGTFYVFPNVEGACRNLGIMEAFASASGRDPGEDEPLDPVPDVPALRSRGGRCWSVLCPSYQVNLSNT